MSPDPQLSLAVVKDVFDRLVSDLAMLSDRDIVVDAIACECRADRPVGEGTTHIAFRVAIAREGVMDHGVLLIPLVSATALAGYLMMVSDAQVNHLLTVEEPDQSVKVAMLEIGNFVAAACDGALRAGGAPIDRVIFEGCQGVRANVRPKLDYVDGQPLIVGRASVAVAKFDATEMVVALPMAAMT